ncbi:hypothetical protein PSEMO_23900 [Pseudomonas putida]|uniref:Uncharacterized protein n=1 Tax=Pseudomonas putida TaxID=303 RepID=A0A1Q9R5I7_PSEPU|nr:hypothetical protein PSEMO_23900 [Pseudomonas putida]
MRFWKTQRGLDGVVRVAEAIAGGGDLDFVAGEEMHGDTADFLIAVIRDRSKFGMVALLSLYRLKPFPVLSPICKTGKSFGAVRPCFPINPNCHSRHPLRRKADMSSPSTLPRPDNIQPRMPIDREMVDRPMGMIDPHDPGLNAPCCGDTRQTSEHQYKCPHTLANNPPPHSSPPCAGHDCGSGRFSGVLMG